jgi:hypothetical protein
MKLNKEWHLSHPMPKNPSFEQRVEWHKLHQKSCDCRPAPGNIALFIKEKTVKA